MKKTKMLKKNYEFKTVFNKGKVYGGKYIVAFIKKNNTNSNLLGIGISVKIAKATKRNHLKRLIRESYSYFEEKIENGNSIVFTCRKGTDIENITYSDVKKDIEKILKKAQVLNSKKEEKNEKDIDMAN